ncbi:MAG: SPOR domain-containing protein [Proteobacteria bacterium]|nr:SPOR domain-containing protein [Pseudomonadota bacterium]
MPREAHTKERKEQNEPRRFSFSLSTAGVASLIVVSAAALAWVFILGVLVGRGYHPEQAVPQLAQIMPRAEQQTAEPEGVLKAEDLDFYETLQKKPGAAPGQSSPKAKPEPDAPVAKASPAAAVQQPPVESPAEPTVIDRQPQAQQLETQQFRYVYQVSSLKDPDMALIFGGKLNKMGLKTSIEQAQASGATWYRVLVHYTGTPEGTDELKAALATVGVKKPIMKSKQPL